MYEYVFPNLLDRVRVDGQDKLVAALLAPEVQVKVLPHVGLDLLWMYIWRGGPIGTGCHQN